jgi:hypothetical protein
MNIIYWSILLLYEITHLKLWNVRRRVQFTFALVKGKLKRAYEKYEGKRILRSKKAGKY